METDEELVQRWGGGRDRGALDELIGRYLSRFYATARAMLFQVEEAEDVAQEAMLKVVRALNRFDTRGSFRAWSYAILMNTAHSSMRQVRQRREGFAATTELADVVQRDEAHGGRIEADERHSALSHAMQRLTEKQRTALVLMVLEGLTAEDVGKIENCSAAAVYQRVTEARRQLRNEPSLKQVWNVD